MTWHQNESSVMYMISYTRPSCLLEMGLGIIHNMPWQYLGTTFPFLCKIAIQFRFSNYNYKEVKHRIQLS